MHVVQTMSLQYGRRVGMDHLGLASLPPSSCLVTYDLVGTTSTTQIQ